MSNVRLMSLLLCMVAPSGLRGGDIQVAWFTDAAIADAKRSTSAADTLPACEGTSDQGVQLTREAVIEWPGIRQDQGYIAFWIKPNWNGDDGRRHQLLRIGDIGSHGILLEKAESGMLRYMMSTPQRTAVARGDVSAWKAGQWHHVVLAWTSAAGHPVGMPLWIDKVCVAGPVFGSDEFPSWDGRGVWIGGDSSDVAMDELILRTDFDGEGQGQIGCVYRDYFRTAPYRSITVDLHPMHGPMDPRVVEGCQKQYGLLAEREGKLERVTDFAVRYAQWSYYDAKPFIRWSTSDEQIASVDDNGLVTGKALGSCTLTAEFRGMTTTRQVEVISIDQPDLDLVYVERLPKYSRDALQDRPAPGDKTQSAARIINFGYATAPAGAEVRFELIPDGNGNFRCDPDEKAVVTQCKTIDRDLQPREEITVVFDWVWTNHPCWVRVQVDPKGKFGEICNANNERCELNIARPLEMAADHPQLEEFYSQRKINHIGSFSEYDWINGQVARFNEILRNAVYATTSPHGVRDTFRVDKTYITGEEKKEWDKEPYVQEERFYDGGFPIREPIDLMSIDAAILHEFGHTCASLPDLYGYGVAEENVFLKDERGVCYAGSTRMPRISENSSIMPFSSANNVPCGAGNPSLMDSCSLWLAPFEAGAIDWFAGYRGGRFWGTQGRMMPAFEQYLRIYDVDDQPLSGAAVYIYHVVNTPCQDAVGKYFPDRPKFIGHTDQDGRFRFPPETDPSWDDADTDQVDGSIKVWNPFGRAGNQSGTAPDVAFTPNVWIVDGLLLAKIVSGDQVEFSFLPLTEFNTVFLAGHRHAGTIEVRTSLPSSPAETPIVRPDVPEAIRKVNQRPVAVLDKDHVTVKSGEEFSLDGSGSSDPEGQPLTYHWIRKEGDVRPERAAGAVLKATAPDRPMQCAYMFYVIDGLRCSEPVRVRIEITP